MICILSFSKFHILEVVLAKKTVKLVAIFLQVFSCGDDEKIDYKMNFMRIVDQYIMLFKCGASPAIQNFALIIKIVFRCRW